MRYRHKRSERIYTVFNRDAEMKHPDTGAWVDCIIYGRVGSSLDTQAFTETYVRAKDDFDNKFEKIT